MWILKTSKYLLETLSSISQNFCNSIKTFDFSTLYTTIPHAQLRYTLKELIQRLLLKEERRTKVRVYDRCSITEQFSICCLYASHLSKWPWSEEYYWHWLLITLTFTWNRQWRGHFKNSTTNDFTFPIVNFPFISNNIPVAPAYGVYISQLILLRYTDSDYPFGIFKIFIHYSMTYAQVQ